MRTFPAELRSINTNLSNFLLTASRVLCFVHNSTLYGWVLLFHRCRFRLWKNFPYEFSFSRFISGQGLALYYRKSLTRLRRTFPSVSFDSLPGTALSQPKLLNQTLAGFPDSVVCSSQGTVLLHSNIFNKTLSNCSISVRFPFGVPCGRRGLSFLQTLR